MDGLLPMVESAAAMRRVRLRATERMEPAVAPVLKPEDGEADTEGEDETDQAGQEQEAAVSGIGSGRRRLLECRGHGG